MAEIFTKKGEVILVDDEDFVELSAHSWYVHEGYAARETKHPLRPGKKYTEYMHRRLLGIPCGDRRKVDHHNENKLDNRKGNLRPCTNAQNLCNRGAQSNNTSGFKGVTWHKRIKKWNAQIMKDGKARSIGYFDDPKKAHEAYCKEAELMHGAFANFGTQTP